MKCPLPGYKQIDLIPNKWKQTEPPRKLTKGKIFYFQSSVSEAYFVFTSQFIKTSSCCH